MKLTIKQWTNEFPAFYLKIGPFLGRRKVISEMGGPIYDEDGKLWFVAMKDNIEMVGFGALLTKGKYDYFCSAYTLPEYRGRQVHDKLVQARLEVCQNIPATMAAPTTRKAYLRHGFKEVSKKGKYTFMVKE